MEPSLAPHQLNARLSTSVSTGDCDGWQLVCSKLCSVFGKSVLYDSCMTKHMYSRTFDTKATMHNTFPVADRQEGMALLFPFVGDHQTGNYWNSNFQWFPKWIKNSTTKYNTLLLQPGKSEYLICEFLANQLKCSRIWLWKGFKTCLNSNDLNI